MRAGAPGGNEWSAYPVQSVDGLVLKESEALGVHDIVLRPGGAVCGRVRPMVDDPASDGSRQVTVSIIGSGTNRTCSVESDGWFEWSPLSPGTYRVTVNYDSRKSRAREVVVKSGQAVELELSLP